MKSLKRSYLSCLLTAAGSNQVVLGHVPGTVSLTQTILEWTVLVVSCVVAYTCAESSQRIVLINISVCLEFWFGFKQ